MPASGDELIRADTYSLLRDFHGLTSKLYDFLHEMTPGMRSVISGQFEMEYSGSNILTVVDSLNSALSALLAASGSEQEGTPQDDAALRDYLDWGAYRLLASSKDDHLIRLYLQNPEGVFEVLRRGRELYREHGESFPFDPGGRDRYAIFEEFINYFSLFGDAVSSRFLDSYFLFNCVLSDTFPRKHVLELLRTVRSAYFSLKRRKELRQAPTDTYGYSFDSKEYVKFLTEGFLRGRLTWDDYRSGMSLDGKIIEVEWDAERAVRVTPIPADRYVPPDAFVGYSDIRQAMEGWIEDLKDYGRVRRVLLAGPSGTGKTTLLKVTLRRLAEEGFTPVYLRRLSGADLDHLESLAKKLEQYLPDGARIVTGIDDIDSVLSPSERERQKCLRQIDEFPYPLIATANPKIPGRWGIEDEAILRRFSNIYHFREPSSEELEGIARYLSRKYEYPITDEEISRIVDLSKDRPGAYIDCLFQYKFSNPEKDWSDISRLIEKHVLPVRGSYLGTRSTFIG